MGPGNNIIEVYQTGELTVVGFGGREILDQIDLTQCRSEIVGLLEKNGCKTLAFDLAGVKLIPSGMLGLLTSLRRMNIEVHLYNPSADVKEVLDITRLSDLMPIHYVDSGGPAAEPG
jgi:anti-sigma B factor antagonist